MIKREAIFKLIEAASGVTAYPDFIPLDATIPAISYSLVSSPDGDRPIEGGVTLQRHFWQIEILAPTRLEGDAIGERLRQLDGMTTDDFQWIAVSEPRDSPETPDTTACQSIVEIETTNRRNRA